MRKFISLLLLFSVLSGCYLADYYVGNSKAGKMAKSFCGKFKFNKVTWTDRNGKKRYADYKNTTVDIYLTEVNADYADFQFYWEIGSFALSPGFWNGRELVNSKFVYKNMPKDSKGFYPFYLPDIYGIPKSIIESVGINAGPFPAEMRLRREDSKTVTMTGYTIQNNKFEITLTEI